jgi:hypothetical protein
MAAGPGLTTVAAKSDPTPQKGRCHQFSAFSLVPGHFVMIFLEEEGLALGRVACTLQTQSDIALWWLCMNKGRLT